MAPKPKRLRMVCSLCGGSNVLADAYAQWDEPTQRWELAQVCVKPAWCNDCGGECSIESRPGAAP